MSTTPFKSSLLEHCRCGREKNEALMAGILTQTQVLYKMLKQSLDISSLTESERGITGYFSHWKDRVTELNF